MSMKVIIVGWDCGSPQLIFDKFKDKLVNVKKIMDEGVWGRLRSVVPPITVPAWRSMVTGKTPGELGMYGFRYRRGNSYTDYGIVMSNLLRQDALWDLMSDNGKTSICSAVPPSYPPYRVKGCLISGFLAPDSNGSYTYPEELKKEIESIVGEYPVDTVFRVDEKDKIRDSAINMTEKHFKVFTHLLRSKKWDFSMHVEIGLDRIQHAFWRYFDKNHHLYEPDSEYKDVVLDYHVLLDRWLGTIMDMIDDDTLLIITSDHGAKAMKGSICVNQWLSREGYLELNGDCEPGQSIQDADVNWKKTKAWGWGGYYSRIFFNVSGRENSGVISLKKLQKEIEKLKKKIYKLRGPNGEEWNTKAVTPEELYENPQGQKPDLMVFWDDLNWRSAGTIGHESMYLKENDIGPDDGVHDWNGMIMAWRKGMEKGLELKDTNLLDIFPTVLKYMGIESRTKPEGKIIEELLN